MTDPTAERGAQREATEAGGVIGAIAGGLHGLGTIGLYLCGGLTALLALVPLAAQFGVLKPAE